MTSIPDIPNMPEKFIDDIADLIIDELLKTPMHILTDRSLNPANKTNFNILDAITIGKLSLSKTGPETGPETRNKLKSNIKTELCKVLRELSTAKKIVETTNVYESIRAYDNAKHYREAIARVQKAPIRIKELNEQIAELEKTVATADDSQENINKRIKYRRVDIEKLQKIANKTVDTDPEYFKCAKHQQEDSAEYLRTMIKILSKPDPNITSETLIPPTIKFTQTTITTCKHKNITTKKTEDSDVLQLALLDKNNKQFTSGYSIQNLITYHEKDKEFQVTQEGCPYDESTPTADGSYNPPGETTTRRDKINIPDENQYIIISLKRWHPNTREKLTISVSINTNITLDTKNYNLVGYINQGGATDHGHYIYNDINLSTNIKYVYNDSSPVLTSPWNSGTSDAEDVYILLYKRQSQGVHDKTYKQTGTLNNVGNSCFLNAGMQLLHRIKPLWEGECKSLVEAKKIHMDFGLTTINEGNEGNENNNNNHNGGRKKKRTVTIKSESIPKTVKGLKTRKKLLKEKIKKAEKKVQLSKNRIIRLK